MQIFIENFISKKKWGSMGSRSGGVWDLDLPPIKAISFGSTLLIASVGGLPISWEAWEITAAGKGATGTACNSFKSIFC